MVIAQRPKRPAGNSFFVDQTAAAVKAAKMKYSMK